MTCGGVSKTAALWRCAICAIKVNVIKEDLIQVPAASSSALSSPHGDEAYEPTPPVVMLVAGAE